MTIDSIPLRFGGATATRPPVHPASFALGRHSSVVAADDEEFFSRMRAEPARVEIDDSGRFVVTPHVGGASPANPAAPSVPLQVVTLGRAPIMDIEDSDGRHQRPSLEIWSLREAHESAVALFPARNVPELRRAGVQFTVTRGVAVAIVVLATGLSGTPALAHTGDRAGERDAEISDTTSHASQREGEARARGGTTQVEAGADARSEGDSNDAPAVETAAPPVDAPPPSSLQPTQQPPPNVNVDASPPAAPGVSPPAMVPSSGPAMVPTAAFAPGTPGTQGGVGSSLTGAEVMNDQALYSLLQKNVMVVTRSGAVSGTLAVYDYQNLTLLLPDGQVTLIPRREVSSLMVLAEPSAASRSGQGRGLRAGGIAMMAVGGAAWTVGAYFAGAFSFSYTGMWVPLVAGGVGLMIGGGFAYAKGKKKGEQALALGLPGGAQVTLAPIVTKRRWGGGLSLRF